jgi:hypothetical protein
MSKKYRVVFAVLIAIVFVGSFVSLYYPYLVKSNINGGDLLLPKFFYGYHFGLTKLILFVMLASIYSVAFIRRQIITVILSLTILILVYLVRYSIHFQGFIDHNYDTKTGVGYLLLFSLAITHIAISVSAFIIQMRSRKMNVTNTLK